MEEESNIVYNPEALNTKVVPTDTEIQEQKSDMIDPAAEPESDIIYNPGAGGSVERADNRAQLNLEDYEGYLGNDIYMPEGDNPYGVLDQSRAKNQSWYEQAGSMLGQAVVGEIIGGTIEGLGYLLDVSSYKNVIQGDADSFDNWLSDIGKGLREGAQEYMPIYQENPGKMDMTDTGWWFSNGVSVASSLSLLIPSMAATKALGFLGKGMSKGAGMISKSMDIASKMGKQQRWMSQGISQAVVSRHMENMMEASGTFDSTRDELMSQIDPETGTYFTEDKANQLAAEAATSNYQLGWAMLLQDIPQYLAIGKVFNPNTMKMENALSKATKSGKKINMKPWQQKVAGGVGTFVSEGAEESFQYYIAERANLRSQLKAGLITEEEYVEKLDSKIGDEEMMSAAFWGGLGGNIFQAAGGGTNELFKSKNRKKWEADYAQNQKDFLQRRGESFAAMQAEIAKADQEGNVEAREQAISEMMLAQTIEAIELDQYDQHIESLRNLTQMSKEERDAFQKEQGVELDLELYKKYVPEIIKTAEKARTKYLKHLNKHDKRTAAAITHNEMQMARFEEQISRNNKEIANIKKDAIGYPFMSEKKKTQEEAKMKIKALEVANKHHSKLKEKTSSETEQKHLDEIIKTNEEAVDLLKKQIEDAESLPYGSVEIHNDKQHKEHLKSALDEAYDYELENVMLSNATQMRAKNNAVMGTAKFKQEQRVAQAKRNVNGLKTTEDVDKAKENLKNNQNFNAKEKKELNKALDERRATLAAEEKAAKEAEQKKQHEEEAARKAKEEAENNPSAVPTNNDKAPIDDGVEDQYGDEVSNFNQESNDLDNLKARKDASTKKSVALLDTVPNTDGFQSWKQNGKNKIGTPVTYELGDAYPGAGGNILRALEIFKRGPKNQNEIDWLTDYLPIRARINDSVYTFLPTKTKAGEAKYFSNYVEQRRIIIDRLLNGRDTTTEVQFTSGGELMEDFNEETQTVPEHSVADLMQIRSLDDVEFMISDEEGVLMDTNKDVHPAFTGMRMVVGVNEDGQPMPYRGGLFLNVHKADGTRFPMKLNFLKNTPEQADVLADLLIKSTVVDGKGNKAEIPLRTTLSALEKRDPELMARVNEIMADEVSVIGKDATLEELVNMFVYVNDRTKGLKSELYRKGGSLHYAGHKLNAKTANTSEGRQGLVDWLTETKRRQFNIKLYNKFPKYKEFIVSNRVVNHNSVINEPLFQSTKSRRVQTWVKPLADDTAPKKTILETQPNVNIPKEIQARMDKSEKIGYTTDENGVSGMYYFYKGGKRNMFYSGPESEVREKVAKKYQAELPKPVSIPNQKPDSDPTPTRKVDIPEDGETGTVLDLDSLKDMKSPVDKDKVLIPFPVKDLDNRTVSDIVRDKEGQRYKHLGNEVNRVSAKVPGGRAQQILFERGAIQIVETDDGSKIQRVIDTDGNIAGIPLMNLTMNAMEANKLFAGKNSFTLTESEISKFFASKFNKGNNNSMRMQIANWRVENTAEPEKNPKKKAPVKKKSVSSQNDVAKTKQQSIKTTKGKSIGKGLNNNSKPALFGARPKTVDSAGKGNIKKNCK